MTGNALTRADAGYLEVRQAIERYEPVVRKLLTGTGITAAQFTAQIANACRAQPKLWECSPASVVGAALRSAQLGLAPNDSRNLAWIIPYGGQATWQLGYGGVMELARRAAPGIRFNGHAVHPGDEFDVDLGRDQPLIYKPAVSLGRDRGGNPYAWWVRAVYPDGGQHVEVLDRDGVEYHRKFSKQPDGLMWTKSYDAAALKSVVLEMRRWLPASPQLAAALEHDETVADPMELDGGDSDDLEREPFTEAP